MKELILSSILIFSLAAVANAAAPEVPGFTYVRNVDGIDEYVLDSNQLRVLLKPQSGAPVATFMVTFRVGSRNEVTGTTGATHLLEHLMFKGTRKFDRGLGTGYDQILERAGATVNATTWLDRTNYFASVATSALPVLIELEADRMRNLSLREEDRRPEMTVVRNEFERGENSPMNALEKELWSAAFLAHPYHHDTIGWRSDIENVPIEKLREFYNTFYWPDNATATVIGEFDPVAALNVIKDKFGAIPKAPHPIPQVYTTEPEQTGQRRVLVKRGGELGIVALAHKIPPGTHADYAAIQVLSSILTTGKTSRCYRELTDKGLTTDVSSWPSFTRDPSLHLTFATLTAEAKHEEIERALVAVMAAIKKDGVTQVEVETAIGSLLASRAFARDGSLAQASGLNECIAVGDWTLFSGLDSKIQRVTPADVQRVARKYLDENHSVAGWFVPAAGQPGDSSGSTLKEENFSPRKTLPPKPLEREFPPLPPTDFGKRVVRKSIAGIDALVCRTSAKEIVNIQGCLRAGEAADRNRALAHLAAGMIERGTKKHDQFAIAGILDRIGAEIDFQVGGEMLFFTAKCLARDVPLVTALIAEQLRDPLFDGDEYAKEQTQLASALQFTLDDTDAQAALAFSQAVYPIGHPLRKLATKDLMEAVRKTSLADTKAFHAQHYGPRDMHLVIVGDVDASAFEACVHEAFDGWQGQASAELAFPALTGGPQNVNIRLPDKTSVSVAIGQPSVQANDPDWIPLSIATSVLGNGFTSRLFANVRDREGLTYHVGARLMDDTLRPGAFQVVATFAPGLLDKGLASIHRQIDSWWTTGITAAELDYAKSNGTGEFAVGLETTNGLAHTLLICALRGFDVSWLDEYPAKLQSVTLDQVNGAIRRHLDPAKMVTARAGTLE